MEQDGVDIMRFVQWVVRLEDMNVVFKYIWPKRLSFLTYGRIVHKVLIFT